jgi:hypothetical protein
MPGDVSMLGQDATISGTFTRYNETILGTMMSFINGAAAGFGPTFSIGTLLQSEEVFAGLPAAPPLALYCPYGAKAEFSVLGNAMIKVFYFYNAYVSDRLSQTLSVRRKAPEITWRAIPKFGSGFGGGFEPNRAPYDAYQLFAVDPQSPSPSALVSLVN